MLAGTWLHYIHRVLATVLLALCWYQLSQQSQDESWVKRSFLSRVFVRREIWGRCRVTHALQEPLEVPLAAHVCTISWDWRVQESESSVLTPECHNDGFKFAFRLTSVASTACGNAFGTGWIGQSQQSRHAKVLHSH